MPNRYPGLNINFKEEYTNERVAIDIFGFWVFLMSDLITFGLLFATYATMKNDIGMAQGPGPKDLFNLTSIGWQTALLLLSSLTAGLSAFALKYDRGNRRVILWMVLTALFGASFLFLELRDFADMFQKGGTPMRSGWLSSFYALVGLHGLHITFGLIWLATMLALFVTYGANDRYRMRLMVFVLYWHFLDLIWIGIYSVVFLGGLL